MDRACILGRSGGKTNATEVMETIQVHHPYRIVKRFRNAGSSDQQSESALNYDKPRVTASAAYIQYDKRNVLFHRTHVYRISLLDIVASSSNQKYHRCRPASNHEYVQSTSLSFPGVVVCRLLRRGNAALVAVPLTWKRQPRAKIRNYSSTELFGLFASARPWCRPNINCPFLVQLVRFFKLLDPLPDKDSLSTYARTVFR